MGNGQVDGSTPQPETGQDPNGQKPPRTPPAARRVDREQVAADKLVQAVLDECHRPLAKRMDRVKASVTLPNKRRLLVQADLPDLARVHEGTRDFLWANQKVHRLDPGATGEPGDSGDSGDPGTEGAADRARIIPLLVRIVDAVAFGPLYRASKCQKSGDDFLLTDHDGVTTTLHLHANTLLPSALTYADQTTVRFDGYLRTKSTWVVNKATLAGLGTCDTIFEDGGLMFATDFFTPPDSASQPQPGEHVRMTSPGAARESEPATPITVARKAAQWVVLSASDDWVQRHQVYAPVHAALEAQNQQIFGFPMIWQSEGKTFLGVPFRPRNPDKALHAPAGWALEQCPETMQLVVYPPSGSLADRIRTGTAQLQRAAANRKLKMIAPIVAQPFVHLHEGAPSAAKLADCKVRMSVRIETP